jgi:predicted ATPase
MPAFIVLTGGPGSGKTTLIDALRRLGLATAPEAGRAIIKEQVAIAGPALPWADVRLFFEVILAWEIRTYRAMQDQPGPVFFDRGVPDAAGGWAMLGEAVPPHVRAAIAAFRYAPVVFLAPPWRAIYTGDTERKQDFAEAVGTYTAMRTAYAEAGYELAELPRAPVPDRLRFVLRTVAERVLPGDPLIGAALGRLQTVPARVGASCGTTYSSLAVAGPDQAGQQPATG